MIPETIRGTAMRADMHVASAGRAMFWIAAIVLAASQTLCNGPDGIPGAVIAETGLLLPSIALIACCAISPRSLRFSRPDRLLAALLIGIVLLAMIQLMPLPPTLWKSLAGRTGLSVEMQRIGVVTGWRPLSLSPLASERSLLALLPAIAIFMTARAVSATDRKRLLQIVMAMGLLSAMLGITQVSQGPDSDLRLFRPSNLSDAVGFFANRNHYGSLLAMLLPFSIGWTIHEFMRKREVGYTWMLRALMPCCATFVLVIGILLSHSRAGLLLSVLAGMGGIAMLWRSGAGIRIVLAVGACGALAGVLALQIAGNDVVSRMTALDLGADTRWPVQATTIAASHRYGALGSGLGTFVNAYQSVAPDYQADQEGYVNHANNDYLELWLETGWMGAALIVLFFIWYARVAIPLWLGLVWLGPASRESSTSAMIARAASLAIGLALVHASVEYQLRKPAIMVLFGLCCALLSVHAAGSPNRQPARPRPDGAGRRRSRGKSATG
jgi:O-antigen ligase